MKRLVAYRRNGGIEVSVPSNMSARSANLFIMLGTYSHLIFVDEHNNKIFETA